MSYASLHSYYGLPLSNNKLVITLIYNCISRFHTLMTFVQMRYEIITIMNTYFSLDGDEISYTRPTPLSMLLLESEFFLALDLLASRERPLVLVLASSQAV